MAEHFYSDIYLNANKIGRDADNLFSFADDNNITFRVDGGDEMFLNGSRLAPSSSNGLALGNTDKQWSDLYLAEGGVINWDNGDFTITQTGNLLTLDGGTVEIVNTSEATDSTGDTGALRVEGGISCAGHMYAEGLLSQMGRSQTDSETDKIYPLGHYTTGKEVFSIDPTWTESQLQEYFDDTNVTWATESDAPAGWSIKLTGAVNVGYPYNSGFPMIPIDETSIYFTECWIKNEDSDQTHYMGSAEKNETFANPSSGQGNTGTFGYHVMSNQNPGTSWTRVTGHITGRSDTASGNFETDANYFSPLALFNYTAGNGTRDCYISGWRIIKIDKQEYFGDGTAALPSITNYDDVDTGIYWNAANELSLTTGGTNRMTINSTAATFAGNVTLSSNSNVVSARKFTARDGNGVMLTADDATSGLSIADNGNATFTGTLTIPSEIIHSGDTDNKIGFTTDTQTFTTGNATRMDITNSGIQMGGSGARVTTILDEDDLSTDSATALATQQSIKAYVDANAGGGSVSGNTYASDLKIGRDADNHLDFATADDTIDVYINGAKDFTFTANTFTAQSGSTIAAQAITATTVDATTDFTIGTTVITDDSIVMTPSTSDTVTIAAASNGVLNITTVDAGGTEGDINITADGKIEYRANDAAGHVFDINGTDQVSIIDGSISPVTSNDIDLGSASKQFKNAWFDGTVETDALTIGGTNILTGGIITTLGTIAQDEVIFSSATENAPVVQIKSTHTTVNAEAELRFVKDASNTEDQESLGMITFYGDDDAGNQLKFAHIRAKINDASNNAEGGRLFLAIASNDGEMQNGLELVDGDAEDEIDVKIGSGSNSITTIKGDLKIEGLNILDDDDVSCISFDSSGNTTISNNCTFSSTSSEQPMVLIQNRTNDSTAGTLKFENIRGQDAQDNDILGQLEFWGYDDGTPSTQQYAGIVASIQDASSGAEEGQLDLKVAAHDGELVTGLSIFSGDQEDEVDIQLGNGANSRVTIPGNLVVGSTTLPSSALAGTADTLTSPRTIGGVSFDGSANIDLPGVNEAGTQPITFSKSSTADGNHTQGDVVYFGSTTSMTAGAIYHFKSDGTWELADADAASTCDGMLGVALGAASDTNGVLLRGMVTLDHDPGAVGDVLFLSTTAGDCSATAPSGNGDIIRVVGYCLDASNGQIYFNPDGTYVEVSA